MSSTARSRSFPVASEGRASLRLLEKYIDPSEIPSELGGDSAQRLGDSADEASLWRFVRAGVESSGMRMEEVNEGGHSDLTGKEALVIVRPPEESHIRASRLQIPAACSFDAGASNATAELEFSPLRGRDDTLSDIEEGWGEGEDRPGPTSREGKMANANSVGRV